MNTQVPTVILTAANIASLLTAAAALVQEVEAIRQQTQDTAPDVWAQVSGDFADAASQWTAAVETPTGHYNDARAITAAAPAVVDGAAAGSEGDVQV